MKNNVEVFRAMKLATIFAGIAFILTDTFVDGASGPLLVAVSALAWFGSYLFLLGGAAQKTQEEKKSIQQITADTHAFLAPAFIWVEIRLTEDEKIRSFHSALLECEKTMHVWLTPFQNEGVHGQLREYSKAELIEACGRIHATPPKDTGVAVHKKRILTASAMIFSFSLPPSCVHVDEETMRYVCCFLCMTKTIPVKEVINSFKQALDAKTHPVNYTDEQKAANRYQAECVLPAVRRISWMIGKDNKRLLPFRSFVQTLQAPGVKTLLPKNDTVMMKKIMTMALLSIGHPVPRDYLCEPDEFVYDYAIKGERYYTFNNKPVVLQLLADVDTEF